MSNAAYDLLTAGARNDPYPVLGRLRNDRPVTFSEQLQAWVVTSYADVRCGLADPVISADRISPRLAQFPEGERDRFVPLYEVLSRWPLMLDHGEHARLRMPITRTMTPATVAGFRQLIRDTARSMLCEGVERGGMDIIAELALPLPLYVTSRILGVPDDAVGLLKRCAVDIVDFFGADPQAYLSRAEAAMEAVLRTSDLLRPMVHARREKPRQDLLSTLAGDPALSDDDIVAVCLMMVFAGFETTSNLIGNGILLLLRHPEQLAAVRRDRELIRGAVKEALRYESPVQRISRLTAAEITLRGIRIEKGSLVYFHAGAANRDPAVFPNPDRFDIWRGSDRHLAFGYSVHTCPGSTLAQAEAEIVLDELCRVAPTVRLTGEPIRWRTNLSVRSLESLPVTFV
ncbi:cytochrome P450 [Nocardia brevicatena]|uniref:cytochrome P450 n=1 Tax=Nocardia brevicatena TaxID=37327 RepID=UPI0002FF914A|nr:cytochrome P450 [Nocardia brevicatena]